MAKFDLWHLCRGDDEIKPIVGEAWRIVEAQHFSVTRKLVDSIEEQQVLEDLLESVKPSLNENDANLGLHYLLFTPFRYPPLAYGSRFGTRLEPSLWYGSVALYTALAEIAFYRLLFLRATTAKLPLVEVWLTAFLTPFQTAQGVDLTAPPFSQYTSLISSPNDYSFSQALGASMREIGVEAFYYESARDPNHQKNIALFTPKTFATKQPKQQSFQTWQCLASQSSVEFIFSLALQKETIVFSIDTFLYEGHFPFESVLIC